MVVVDQLHGIWVTMAQWDSAAFCVCRLLILSRLPSGASQMLTAAATETPLAKLLQVRPLPNIWHSECGVHAASHTTINSPNP
jgi:hypothetical protein